MWGRSVPDFYGKLQPMVWFYTRADDRVRLETRLDATNEYVVQVEWPDRPLVIERFPEASAFDVRVRAIEQQLEGERWELVGDEVLPHGWRGPITH